MPIFPLTRCPDCGTMGCTGRICPACRYTLWQAVIHFTTPEGREGLVHRDEGYDLVHGGGQSALLEKANGDDPKGRDKIIPVVLINGGSGWLRWDGEPFPVLYDRDLEPAYGLPIKGSKAREKPSDEPGEMLTGTRHGILGRLGWSPYPRKLERLAEEGAITLEQIENSKRVNVTILRPELAYNRSVKAPARPRPKKPEKSGNPRNKP